MYINGIMCILNRQGQEGTVNTLVGVKQVMKFMVGDVTVRDVF